MDCRRGNTKGFTLIEILIVVFILTLLAAVIAPRLIGRADDALIAQAKIQITNFQTALKLFKLDNGFYPDTDQGLVALAVKPASGQMPLNWRDGGYLERKKIPLDPWKNQYVYISPGLKGDFDIISYGADRRPGGDGKDADICNWDIEQ